MIREFGIIRLVNKMKLEVKGTFKDREEMESQKYRIRKLLLDFGDFKDVRTNEDLITGEYHFWCNTETTRKD